MTTAVKVAPEKIEVIEPQPGAQTEFLSSPADIVVFGGGAGGSKTFGLLLEPLRHIEKPYFEGVIFRKTMPMIIKGGGLYTESRKIYGKFEGIKTTKKPPLWTFNSGAKVAFDQLHSDAASTDDLQGSQYSFMGMDELTQFTEDQFFYCLSRLRSADSGAKPYLRATCNPAPDSWVRQLLDWYIDEDGFPDKSKSGIIRYFVVENDSMVWGDTKEELIELYPTYTKNEILSFTYIPATILDNKILMEKDPTYIGKLKALPYLKRRQLLEGNWNAQMEQGDYFRTNWFKHINQNEVPKLIAVSRGWDFAATDESDKKSKNADYTASVKIGKDQAGNYYILDTELVQYSPAKIKALVRSKALEDSGLCTIRLPQDPGQAGKYQVDDFKANVVPEFDVKSRVMSTNKRKRAEPLSAEFEKGNVYIVYGPWNNLFESHAKRFPPAKGSPDIIDAAVEAFVEVYDADSGNQSMNYKDML